MKHFVDISDFHTKELDSIIKKAIQIKNNPKNFSSKCKNKTLGMIFQKQSTRTRVSFNVGFQKLGGHSLELNNEEIGFGKRESYKDIVKVLSQFIDVLMIRNDDHKIIRSLSSLNSLPIINGLSDYSHPCQILSDLLTLKDIFGELNIKISWFGDVNNVLYSLIEAANLIEEIELFIFTPEYCEKKISLIINKNIKILNKIDLDILNNCDCVMTDVFISMNDNIDNEKINSLMQYQVNQKVMEATKNECVFMHCLPADKGQEATQKTFEDKRCVALQEAENRMHLQKSILRWCIGLF